MTKRTVKSKQETTREGAIFLIQTLLQGLQDGTVAIGEGEEQLQLDVAENLKMSIKGKLKGDKAKLSLSLSWICDTQLRVNTEFGDGPVLAVPSDPPAVAETSSPPAIHKDAELPATVKKASPPAVHVTAQPPAARSTDSLPTTTSPAVPRQVDTHEDDTQKKESKSVANTAASQSATRSKTAGKKKAPAKKPTKKTSPSKKGNTGNQ